MPIEAAPDPGLILAQWFSPGYPTGAFAYSHGLETAVASGAVQGAAALRHWIGAVLRHGAGRNDAILLAAAWRADPAALAGVEALAQALAVSAERLEEARAQGAAFARTTALIWGLDLPALTYPVAAGRAARLLGLPLDPVLRHYLMAVAANLVSAGVRLIPLGQTEGQAALAGLAGPIEGLALEARDGDTETLGGAALAADIAAMRHETLDVRLFRT
jgi:urease accessory protein